MVTLLDVIAFLADHWVYSTSHRKIKHDEFFSSLKSWGF